MTQYKLKYLNETAEIEVSGHSGYADNGYDIVCASISTACILSANLIDKLDLGYNIINLVCEDGYFKLQIKCDNQIVVKIFENLIETLDSLANDYPKALRKN